MTWRWLATVVVWALSASSAAAYYHFIHYTSRNAPFGPSPEKFDLAAIPNKTVTFLVSEAGPTQFSPNDGFPAVLGQIRQATQVWNSVDTSDLRVVFGGLFTPGALPSSTPGGEVVFDELPPGVLGYGGPTAIKDVSFGANGPFVPVLRAVVRLNRDLTKRPGPSNSDSFFATVVHEMGHALGLQHTLTSSAMSTPFTRATSRAAPLDTDDIAGISLLYPARNFLSATGSISGRVTSGGQGVHLASVVALRPDGSAVSALTNPDGSYRIDGLPGDQQYFVYTHPLPPASQDGFAPADLKLPKDADSQDAAASGPFDTVFYPGTRDLSQATTVRVKAGTLADGINFSVNWRPAVSIYDVQTYSFFGDTASKPAFFNSNVSGGTLVARGPGITAGDSPAPGLTVQVLGGFANVVPGSFRAYGNPVNLAVDLAFFGSFSGTGERHLLFATPSDIYVLPGGLNLVGKQPPAITSMKPGADGAGTVTIAATNLGPDSQVYFDGLPATVQSFMKVDDSTARAVVTPPPGAGNQRAAVTVLNSDGQNSSLVQTPPTYTYEPLDTQFVTIVPNALPAGAESMVEVTGVNTRFADGQTILGFGTSDIFVKRVWVTGANRLLANIAIAPSAPAGTPLASVISGFQIIPQHSGLQVQPPNPKQPVVNSQVLNAVPGQTGIYPGAIVTLFGVNLAAPSGGTTITIDGNSVTILYAFATQVNFQVPSGLNRGPAVLQLNNGVDNAFPIVVQIDPAPPKITAVAGSMSTSVDPGPGRPAQGGDLLTLLFQDAIDPGAVSRVRINVGGVEHQAITPPQASSQPGQYQLQFVLSNSVGPGSQVPVTLTIDGRTSLPFFISVRGS